MYDMTELEKQEIIHLAGIVFDKSEQANSFRNDNTGSLDDRKKRYVSSMLAWAEGYQAQQRINSIVGYVPIKEEEQKEVEVTCILENPDVGRYGPV